MVRASEQAALAPPRAATSPTPSPLPTLVTYSTLAARHELPPERSSAREIVTISCIVSRRPSLHPPLVTRFSHRYSIRYSNAPAVRRALQRVLESCTRRRRTRASRLIYAGQRARTKATWSFVFDETVGVASSSHHGMRRQQRATVNSRPIL